MVQLLIKVLGGDLRQKPKVVEPQRFSRADSPKNSPIACYHVDSRLSEDIQDIGRIRWGKLFWILKYCLEAVWCRFRYGVTSFYYVPAPGVRSAVYRDWIVMALCRPFFRKMVLHWEAVGLGSWLETEAKPFERWMTRRLLGNADLSIVLGPFYRADAAKLAPKRIEVIPNAIPDPCPGFEKEILPRRLARRATRARLLAGEVSLKPDLERSGSHPQIFRVLYMSLCTREKGLFDTLEAVALANQKLFATNSPLRIHLTVAGKFWQESERLEFDDRVAQRDLNGSGCREGEEPVIGFRGFISGTEKDLLFRESDCFCFPTYYAMEGHPVSLVEAMAYDLPIIATRWRAVPVLFPAGYPGLVEPRSPEQIAGILNKFIEVDQGNSFRETFLENFLEARFAQRMETVLQEGEAG